MTSSDRGQGGPASPPTYGAGRETTDCLLCGHSCGSVHARSTVQLSPATGETFSFLRCERCELVYLSPRPTREAMSAYYPPDYLPFRGAAAWGRWAPFVRSAEARMDRARVRLIRRHAEVSRGVAVLDVGCGRPTFLEALRRKTGARCVGIDPSRSGWRAHPERWAALELVEGTVESRLAELSALAPEGFRAITLWHALEHEHEPLRLLRALRELASPGATLLVEVPDLSGLTARIQGPDWGGFHTPRHTAAYTPKTLAAMLERSGWSMAWSSHRGTLDPYTLWWLGRAAAKGDALAGSQEGRFPAFLLGKVWTLPIVLLQGRIPLGIQIGVARKTAGERLLDLGDGGSRTPANL